MWEAKNKVTGHIYGPYTDAQKQSMDERPETRRKYDWTQINIQPKPVKVAAEPTAARKKKKEAPGPDDAEI